MVFIRSQMTNQWWVPSQGTGPEQRGGSRTLGRNPLVKKHVKKHVRMFSLFFGTRFFLTRPVVSVNVWSRLMSLPGKLLICPPRHSNRGHLLRRGIQHPYSLLSLDLTETCGMYNIVCQRTDEVVPKPTSKRSVSHVPVCLKWFVRTFSS